MQTKRQAHTHLGLLDDEFVQERHQGVVVHRVTVVHLQCHEQLPYD